MMSQECTSKATMSEECCLCKRSPVSKKKRKRLHGRSAEKARSVLQSIAMQNHRLGLNGCVETSYRDAFPCYFCCRDLDKVAQVTFDVSIMLQRLSPSRPTATFDRDTDVLMPLESPIQSSPLRTNVFFSDSSLVSSVPSSVKETDFVTGVEQGKESFLRRVPFGPSYLSFC